MRYGRAEGFFDDVLTVDLNDDNRPIFEALMEQAEQLAEDAGVSVEDAQTALVNQIIYRELKRLSLENTDGGGI